METFVLVLHVLIATVMTFFILMQQGKGADAGASFGAGGSQTVFGSAGSASFLTKLTAGLALVFFATSMILAVYAKQHVSGAAILPGLNVKAPVKPANTDIPAPAPAVQAAASAPANADIPAASSPATPSNPPANPVK
jgi:preprotein translocase subunit SecG